MDMLLIVKALLMGVIEGATEFLPISSTGHLIIAGDVLRFLHKPQRDVFEIFIQLGAILAVCVFYRARFLHIARHVWHEPTAQSLLLNILLAFLPLALIGLLLHQPIKALLFNPNTVAIALIVGGLVILWLESLDLPEKITTVEHIQFKQAIQIGCWQALALIPGVSRAGATILGGMGVGLSRQVATEFSFFLAVPVIVAASSYDLIKHRELLSLDDLGLFALGFVTAFLSALLAIKTLIRYVAKHNFKAFAYYRIALGLLVLYWF